MAPYLYLYLKTIMKGNKKLRGIAALMVLSEVLLLVFLFYWVNGQFRKESSLLEEELSRQFTGSKEQMMDSMIVMRYIDPLLKDKKNFQVKVLTEDSVFEDGHTMKKRTLDISAGLSLPRKSPDSLIRVFSRKVPGPSDPADSMLLKGVKLFIDEVGLPRNDSAKMTWELAGTDTALVHKLLSEKMHSKGMNFTLKWSIGGTDEEPGVLMLAGHLPGGMGLEVGHYKFYIWKKVIPQILFALVLLLLCGAAFIISYRSLSGQMRLNALKNDFISNISHELKTPVSTVKVAVEALQSGDMKNDPQKTKDYLHMASLEIERLDLLISKVLNNSLLEGGKLALDPERTDLSSLIRDTLALMQIRISESGAAVKFENMDELPVRIDKLHIQGVLINLLDNSLKYSGVNPQIDIKAWAANGKAFITVKDRGPGIPSEYLNKVFEKFFRVPSGDRHNVKGHGLGLNYAALIMQQHGGSIAVANNPDKGCTFTLTFPSA